MILGTHGIIGSQIVQFSPQIAADAFYARVTDAGGSLTSTEESAILNLVTDLVNFGLWDKMKAIYPMVGASAAACAQNLKSSSFTGTFTATGWTFASTGVTPLTAFMNTNHPSNLLNNNSIHLSYYSRTNAGGNSMEIGTVNPDFHLWFKAFNLTRGNLGSNITYTPTLIDTSGFLIVSKYTASQALIQFKNSQQLTSASGDNRTSKNIFVGAVNDTGTTAAFYSTKECAFASIGEGLNTTEASDFYTAVQAFQTTLNRAIAP